MLLSFFFHKSYCDDTIIEHKNLTSRLFIYDDSNIPKNICIIDSNFEGLSTFLYGGAIYLTNFRHIDIHNTRFVDCSADQGGAIYLTLSRKSPSLNFSKLCIQNCSAAIAQVLFIFADGNTKIPCDLDTISIYSSINTKETSSIIFSYSNLLQFHCNYFNASKCQEKSHLPIEGTFYCRGTFDFSYSTFDSIQSQNILLRSYNVSLVDFIFLNNTIVNTHTSSKTYLIYSDNEAFLMNVTFKQNNSPTNYVFCMNQIIYIDCISDRFISDFTNLSDEVLITNTDLPFEVSINCRTPEIQIEKSNLVLIFIIVILITTILMIIAIIFIIRMRKRAKEEHRKAELTRSILQDGL